MAASEYVITCFSYRWISWGRTSQSGECLFLYWFLTLLSSFFHHFFLRVICVLFSVFLLHVCRWLPAMLPDGDILTFTVSHLSQTTMYIHVYIHIHRVPKLATPLASNTVNSVWSSWISTKYRTLHYLNITHCCTYYDVRTLPCVLSVTKWRQSLRTVITVWDKLDQRIDKAIKQWRTRLRACVEAKCGHFEHKL